MYLRTLFSIAIRFGLKDSLKVNLHVLSSLLTDGCGSKTI